MNIRQSWSDVSKDAAMVFIQEDERLVEVGIDDAQEAQAHGVEISADQVQALYESGAID